ncbi:hypothetical protein L210DRAFT_2617569 [Boletus edulis BED1]|uniref:Uncharacterized protein n=1 Tax=Boletus edulis BED1 TaxID=1328754 RepID=A0AAD4C4H2_BOLED|nr:hypothetical protein L210DRAFT_2617569 [Boletus edulis BED1]
MSQHLFVPPSPRARLRVSLLPPRNTRTRQGQEDSLPSFSRRSGASGSNSRYSSWSAERYVLYRSHQRGLPVLNVFRNRQPLPGHAVRPLRSTGSDVQRSRPVAQYDAPQRHRISDANATSSPAQALKAHAQPSKWHTRCGAHKAWLKWRGPLPRTNTLRRRHLRGSAVFAQRCRHGRRLVTRFWLRQRVDPHVIRWLKLCSIALHPPRIGGQKS